MVDVTAVTGVGRNVTLGEGPLWDPFRSVLWWVDILGSDIHQYRPADGSERSWHIQRMVSAIVTRSDGSLLTSTEDGFGSFDPATGESELLVPLETHLPTNRLNDAKVDPAGRLWGGTMEFDGAKGMGTLYRLDPDLTCTPMVRDVSISNGIDWSLDARVMYYVDTPTRRVDAFDYDLATGSIENRRIFVTIPEAEGMPDGITVDAEGHVWVALSGGWCVQRYSPDGAPSGRVGLPVSKITSCTFGGPDLDELFITTAADGFDEQAHKEQPLAGAVFRARPGVSGRPANNFGG